MKDIEAVAILKKVYPGMSKSIYSQAKKPEYYGVELTPLAKLKVGIRRTEKRRKPYRVSFRLSSEEFEQFELARGSDTRQDFCSEIIRSALQI